MKPNLLRPFEHPGVRLLLWGLVLGGVGVGVGEQLEEYDFVAVTPLLFAVIALVNGIRAILSPSFSLLLKERQQQAKLKVQRPLGWFNVVLYVVLLVSVASVVARIRQQLPH